MKTKLGNKKGDPVVDPRDEFIRAMLRNFEVADADGDGVVTFSGTLMTYDQFLISYLNTISVQII